MNFILCERYGLKYLIIESTYPQEYWTLSIFPYNWSFDKYRPSLASMNGMSIKMISDKEGLKMLQEHADRTEVKQFIEQYEAIPF